MLLASEDILGHGHDRQEGTRYLSLRIHLAETPSTSRLPTFPTSSAPNLGEFPLGSVGEIAWIRMGFGCEAASIQDIGMLESSPE